ncbi:MAG: YaiI/YqxD family protein [Deltaproteobacteria bacterium]|nr:YaiI/YqxD family protein [Deltaproteobacteria bacterium]
MSKPTLWIDGDAAPKACKEVVYRASARTGLNVVFVANSHHSLPKTETLRFIQVQGGPDVADDYIAEHCQKNDLVLTEDIPLAARIIEAEGTVLRFRGEALTEENVREKLSVRDFMDDLRNSGVVTGGPPPFKPKDKQKFANALDTWIARNL